MAEMTSPMRQGVFVTYYKIKSGEHRLQESRFNESAVWCFQVSKHLYSFANKCLHNQGRFHVQLKLRPVCVCVCDIQYIVCDNMVSFVVMTCHMTLSSIS